MREIMLASAGDKTEILKLYKMQLGREFCPWDEHYPEMDNIEFDLERDNLIIMKERGSIIAAISIDVDEQVDRLECWSDDLKPGGELARLAVHPQFQNQSIARKMIKSTMKLMVDRGYRSVHFLVNKYNDKALNSYRKLGFNKVGECFMYEQPFYCYEKELVKI